MPNKGNGKSYQHHQRQHQQPLIHSFQSQQGGKGKSKGKGKGSATRITTGRNRWAEGAPQGFMDAMRQLRDPSPGSDASFRNDVHQPHLQVEPVVYSAHLAQYSGSAQRLARQQPPFSQGLPPAGVSQRAPSGQQQFASSSAPIGSAQQRVFSKPTGLTQPFGQAAAQDAQYAEHLFYEPPIFSDPEAVAAIKIESATLKSLLRNLNNRMDPLSQQLRAAYTAQIQDLNHRVTARKPLEDQIVSMRKAVQDRHAKCLNIQQHIADTKSQLEHAILEVRDVEGKLEDLLHQLKGPTPQPQQQQPPSPPHDSISIGELGNALQNPDFIGQTSEEDRAGAERLFSMLTNFLATTRQPQPAIVTVPVESDAYQQPVPEGVQTPSDLGRNFDYSGMENCRPFVPEEGGSDEIIPSTPARLSCPSSPRLRVYTRVEPASPARVVADDEELMEENTEHMEKKMYVPSAFFLSLQDEPHG